MSLDEAQLLAINHKFGPAMILAGPGSGKTTVITHRIKNLIQMHNVSPDKILVISFTKLAASQMKKRFLAMLSGGDKVVFGTFHAVFFMILKSVYNFKAEDIVRVKEQYNFVKAELLANGVVTQDENSLIADIISEISKVKAASCDIDKYFAVSCDTEVFRSIYKEYNKFLSDNHKLDFEDMMVRTYNLLKARTDVLKLWQERFNFVLIDEFQDSSPVQFEIVKLLCERHKNIFVVGDDDQSIYGFRGAAPRVMRDFTQYYKNTSIYNLNINYRSDKNIVDAATKVINCNSDRFFKDLRAYNKATRSVEFMLFDNTMQQADFVLRRILEDNVGQNKSIAVLTRLNNGASWLQNLLSARNIPFNSSGKSDNMFSHWIAKDIIAYIKIAIGYNDRELYLRIINKPLRYISRQFFVSHKVDIEDVISRMAVVNQTGLIDRISEFNIHMGNIAKLKPYAGVMYIRKVLGYEGWLKEYSKDSGIKRDGLIEIIDEICESAKTYETYELWLEMIENVTQNCGKNSMNLYSNINFCTMHSSKGLEFDIVFILDVNDGIIPYSKAYDKESIEEERRLFYVGMTRAKSKLYICSVKERYNKTMQPSIFVRELHGNFVQSAD